MRHAKIIGIEGPCLVGKTTFTKKLKDLLWQKGYHCYIIPEYVDYLGDQNLLPERPLLLSRKKQIQEAYFYMELEKIRQREMQKVLNCNKVGFVILDRTFFTCLAYSVLSGNPIATQIYQKYIDSKSFIYPDMIYFLTFDYNSKEYERRKRKRMAKTSRCRGLNYKNKDYGYIYQSQAYEDFFRKNILKKFNKICFVNSRKCSKKNLPYLLKNTVLKKVYA